jgi:hypothetical protein
MMTLEHFLGAKEASTRVLRSLLTRKWPKFISTQSRKKMLNQTQWSPLSTSSMPRRPQLGCWDPRKFFLKSIYSASDILSSKRLSFLNWVLNQVYGRPTIQPNLPRNPLQTYGCLDLIWLLSYVFNDHILDCTKISRHDRHQYRVNIKTSIKIWSEDTNWNRGGPNWSSQPCIDLHI